MDALEKLAKVHSGAEALGVGVLSFMKGRHVFPKEAVIRSGWLSCGRSAHDCSVPWPFCWVILGKSFLCLGQAGQWPNVFLATLKYWARELSRGLLFSLVVFLCVYMGPLQVPSLIVFHLVSFFLSSFQSLCPLS